MIHFIISRADWSLIILLMAKAFEYFPLSKAIRALLKFLESLPEKGGGWGILKFSAVTLFVTVTPIIKQNA